jgi:hypothetical protein
MSVEVEVPEVTKHEYAIVVNSRPHTVPSKTVTYDEVARIAYPDWAEGDQFKVTYRKADHGEWKLLSTGGVVHISAGEEFIVERTHRS